MPKEVGEGEALAADTDSILSQMNAGLDGEGGGGTSGEGEGAGEGGGEGEGLLDIDDILPPEKKGDEGEGEGEGEGEEEGEGKGKEKDDEDEDEDEDEDLLEGEDESDLREETPQIIQEVEKAYPKLFKQFKGVKIALLRDDAFSRVFSTPREASEVAQLNEGYREFENELLGGDHAKVLSAIKRTNEGGYKRFVSGILPTLAQHDQALYGEVTAPVIAGTLKRVIETGTARGDKNLVNSAKHIASLIWPTFKGQIPDLTHEAPKSDPALEERERRIAQREQEQAKKEAEVFVVGIKSTCNRLLRKRIEKGLDPNNALSPFLKNTVVDKTMAQVQELLNEDLRFNRAMETTFARAKRSGYSGEYKTRMVGTYIGRATQLIGPIRRRLVLAALNKRESGGGGDGKPPVRRQVGEGGASGSQGRITKASDINWEATSDMDILSGKVKSRRATK